MVCFLFDDNFRLACNTPNGDGFGATTLETNPFLNMLEFLDVALSSATIAWLFCGGECRCIACHVVFGFEVVRCIHGANQARVLAC